MRKSLLVAAMSLVSMIASTAQATVWTFNVTIDGEQEVPPQNVPISPGMGTAIVTFDDTTGNMVVNGAFSGLTAAANAAHIHGFAPEDVAAGVLFGLDVTNATSGTVTGSGSFTLDQVPLVLGGQTYINIHSPGTYAAGEIRGQLVNPIPEPATIVLGAVAFALLTVVAVRRRNT